MHNYIKNSGLYQKKKWNYKKWHVQIKILFTLRLQILETGGKKPSYFVLCLYTQTQSVKNKTHL